MMKKVLTRRRASLTAGSLSSADLAALLPPDWPPDLLDVPLVRIFTCGTLRIEVLLDVHPGADRRPIAVYGPQISRVAQRKGMRRAQLLLTLLASKPHGLASKDWLMQTMPMARQSSSADREDEVQEEREERRGRSSV
jgi:hypothetical protein